MNGKLTELLEYFENEEKKGIHRTQLVDNNGHSCAQAENDKKGESLACHLSKKELELLRVTMY